MMEYVLLITIAAVLLYGLYTIVNVGGFLFNSIQNLVGEAVEKIIRSG